MHKFNKKKENVRQNAYTVGNGKGNTQDFGQNFFIAYNNNLPSM